MHIFPPYYFSQNKFRIFFCLCLQIRLSAMWESFISCLCHHKCLKLTLDCCLTNIIMFGTGLLVDTFQKSWWTKDMTSRLTLEKICYELLRQLKKNLMVWDHSIWELKQIFVQLPSWFKVTFKWFNYGLKITYRLSH